MLSKKQYCFNYIDTNCDSEIGDIQIEYSETLLCILNESNNIICKNVDDKNIFRKQGDYKSIDVFKDTICSLDVNQHVQCWNEYGDEILYNSNLANDIIATYSDGYCGLIQDKMYCRKFNGETQSFPALLHQLTDLDSYYKDTEQIIK